MSAARVLRCYGDGHLAILGDDQPRIDIDPVLPDDKEARAEAIAALPAEFLVLTHGGADALDDTVDLLEAKSASVLVAGADLCDRADDELDLQDRLVDLADWDRIRLAGASLTGLSAARGGLPGLDGLPGIDALPDPRGLFSSATATLGRALESLPLVGGLARQGEGLLGGGRRRALHLAIEGGPAVLLASDNLSGGSVDAWLDELADELEVDLLVAAVGGDRVEGLVHAVRTLAPRRVVLYRDHDPYAGKERSLPIDRFVAALAEDQPDLKVSVLRAGEELTLSV